MQGAHISRKRERRYVSIDLHWPTKWFFATETKLCASSTCFIERGGQNYERRLGRAKWGKAKFRFASISMTQSLVACFSHPVTSSLRPQGKSNSLLALIQTFKVSKPESTIHNLKPFIYVEALWNGSVTYHRGHPCVSRTSAIKWRLCFDSR